MLKHRGIRGGVLAAAVTMSFGLSAYAPVEAAVTHAGRAQTAPAPGTISVLYSFAGSDGANPQGGLEYGIRTASHALLTTLFGATQNGGVDNIGTLFAQPLQGTAPLTSVFGFTGSNGSAPTGGLAGLVGDYTNDGPFVGVTSTGGKFGYGALYEATANGAETVLYSFTGAADGANPAGRLVYFKGAYYGTTSAGALGFGSVFSYSPQSGFKTLHTFTGANDGATPLAGLSLRLTIPSDNAKARAAAATGRAIDAQKADASFVDPYLYGTTSNGGANGGNGTVFKISTTGHLTTLHTFEDTAAAPGASPSAELSTDFNGNLYGTTFTGGSAGFGEVFVYTSAGVLNVIHDFGVDPTSGLATTGGNPLAPLTVSLNGNVYGTSSTGSLNSLGNVFSIGSSGFSIKYEFAGPDGASPQGKLVDGLNGVLYGTTFDGGANGLGEIFAIAE